ncbi:MAG: hypothetical protein RTU30_00680 [Candidatus Thorarchaeota archaeon]
MKFMLGGLGNWFNDFENVKNVVLEADKLGFMTGSMMGRPITGADEFVKAVESAKDAGHKYYLVSLPRDETGIEAIRKFAKEVMPSFK